MEKILAIVALFGFTTVGFAQGQINWANTSATLITLDGVALPPNWPLSPPFYFGLFVAPYGTPDSGYWDIEDPNWQNVVAYTMNSTAAAGAGRMLNPGVATVPGYVPGSTVNFIIRGWQSSTGGADWPAAKPGLTYYARTTMGSVILGGAAFPIPSAFGVEVGQVGGFELILIPEPSSIALTSLGVLMLPLFRRCRCARY